MDYNAVKENFDSLKESMKQQSNMFNMVIVGVLVVLVVGFIQVAYEYTSGIPERQRYFFEQLQKQSNDDSADVVKIYFPY